MYSIATNIKLTNSKYKYYNYLHGKFRNWTRCHCNHKSESASFWLDLVSISSKSWQVGGI